MKSAYLLHHLAAIVLSALALWSLRHEYTEKATRRVMWVLSPIFAVLAAAILLYVSPGKRFEMWVAAIVVGLLFGGVMGTIMKINQDFGLKLMRVARTWNGLIAASLLFLLAVSRLVTSDVMTRQSGKFGVLGASASFLAAFLVGRYLLARFYNAPKAIHLDMVAGHNPHRTLIN